MHKNSGGKRAKRKWTTTYHIIYGCEAGQVEEGAHCTEGGHCCFFYLSFTVTSTFSTRHWSSAVASTTTSKHCWSTQSLLLLKPRSQDGLRPCYARSFLWQSCGEPTLWHLIIAEDLVQRAVLRPHVETTLEPRNQCMHCGIFCGLTCWLVRI